jgi:hypothetical protein
MLYSQGEGPFPCVLPLSRSKGGGGDGPIVNTDTCVSTRSQGCEDRYKVWAKAEKLISLHHVFVRDGIKRLTLIYGNNACRDIITVTVADSFTQVD